jgi:pyruvate kinase
MQAEKVLNELRGVRAHVQVQGERILARWRPQIARAAFEPGAANLAHYLAMRQLDLRPLEAALVPLGLPSLGRIESRVMPSMTAVTANLELICRVNEETPRPDASAFRAGREALTANTTEVLGPPADGRRTRILVTLGAKAAKDPEFVRGLVAAGMDCARVNCAHDGPETWRAMIDNVRAAAAERGRSCRILMDLAGPKIRTETVRIDGKRKVVQAGDRILLTYGEPAETGEIPFRASCSAPEVLRQISVGAAISIKDGLIRGRVEAVRGDGLVMFVERTPPDGQPLDPEKGINFPKTDLVVRPLTDDDLSALDFAAQHADIISYSFVQRPADIALLQSEILSRRPDGPPMPIVAKIETRLAVANLPELIVQAAGGNPFAVMIARGDLAVEIGYERLSEIQEEILWLCEAAHVPVIWATQVLESLVKRGMPSRGEFTDAAMAERAECVMLNKGPHVVEGITVLDNVLRRMESHRIKRSAQLRPLKVWGAQL